MENTETQETTNQATANASPPPANIETTTVEALSPLDQRVKKNGLIAYALMGLGVFTGLAFIAAIIFAYATREEAKQSKFADHYSNIIKTFWISFCVFIVGCITAVLVIGYFIILVNFLYVIIKVAKGAARLNSDKPYKQI
ncbi:DUF4870 family protein [Vibrio casei]|uniref:DUF4870 family protein n=1 Tax=Vibrio casei TaxID=673372 RepID=UPI000B5CC0BE|nr:hypothetical protein [Vibrio casei]